MVIDVLLLWRGSIRVAFDAFPITVHELQAVDTMYSSHAPELNTRRSRNIDISEDQSMIAAEVEKYPHPLEDNKFHLYNPVTDQFAPTDVNVVDSFFIGEKMERACITILPEGFTVLFLVYY